MTRLQLLSILLCGCLLLSTTLRSVYSEEDEYEEEEYDGASEEDQQVKFDESDVVVLTKHNLQEKVDSVKYALVEFYVPGCGYCQALAPKYAKAATTLKAYDDKIMLAKADVSQDDELADEFGIDQFPTLKWFVDGNVSDYTGGHDEESIVHWIKKKTGPPAHIVNNVSELESTEKENEVCVVGYFSAYEGKDFEAYFEAAKATDYTAYVHTTSKEVAAAAGITGDKTPAFVIIKNFKGYEREVVPFGKEITTANLVEFENIEKLPLVTSFNEKTQELILNSGIEKHAFVIAQGEKLDHGGSFIAMLNSVAKNLKGRMMMVTVDLDDEEVAGPIMDFFEVNKKDAPVICGFQMSDNRKYRFQKQINEVNLKAWCEDFVANRIEPHYKSQEPPEIDEEDNVKIVVGKTFEKIVKDPKKDVLLEVYAPWCQHCQQLEPIYKKLAKRFADVESVVIAKMDGTENEHADVQIQGFPTLFLFPAGEETQKITYEESERTLLSLTKFIKMHAKIPYELQLKSSEEKSEKEEPTADNRKEPAADTIKDEL
eukprot:g2667.t1